MSISPGSAADPHNEPAHDETDSLPDEEHVDPAKVDEQLDTEPGEAENFTHGYAPEDDHKD